MLGTIKYKKTSAKIFTADNTDGHGYWKAEKMAFGSLSVARRAPSVKSA
jgi:hypothetical protein